MNSLARALIKSLLQAPLLVGDLPGASTFNRALLGMPCESRSLNFEQKLGHLYEDALEQLIEASDSLELLASHLQIVNTVGRTLGELDFLLMDRIRQQPIHLELAVKFYLAVEGVNGWEFPGPDPRDNWQRKLDRMRTHQLKLCERNEARQLLSTRFGFDSVKVRQLIYGCLFYPISSVERHVPEAVNPQCRTGRWLYVSEWQTHFAQVDSVRFIPKVLWPVELNEELLGELEVVSTTQMIALAKERCALFTHLDSNEPTFLVPDDWLLVGK